ncbi:hypothetical protein Hanom_Chr16g01423811 [Helianthus anomalus]
MARQTRSSSGDSPPTFIHQNILQDPEKEICSFDSATCRLSKPTTSSRKGRCSGRLIRKSDQTWFLGSGCALTLFPLP